MSNSISFYNVELCCTTLCFKTIIQILSNFSVLAPPTCDISIGTCTATSSDAASTAILVDLAECPCMQHAGVHGFQLHAGASQRMLKKCWRIRLYPNAPGRTILTTSAVSCYTQPCSILACHDFMPWFTEPDCCTIPYHLSSHLPLRYYFEA